MFSTTFRLLRTTIRHLATKKSGKTRKASKLETVLSGPYFDQDLDIVDDRLQYVTEENQYEELRKVVTPLANIPYEEQIEYKTNKVDSVMKDLQKRLFLEKRRMKYAKGLLPCPVDMMKASPVTEKYRNKDEFNLGPGVNQSEIVAGMFIGRPKQGVVCVRPRDIRNMRPSHTGIAQLYEDFVRSSKLPACLNFSKGGNWRGVTVRSNEKGDHMVIVLFHPQNLDKMAIENAKSELVEYFQNGPGKEGCVRTLYFQQCRHTRCTREQAPYELLFGEPYLYETVNGLNFRISPDSFFQLNRAAAEVLYNSVHELAGVSKASTVLDICCGVGTIGMLLAKDAERVIGLDSVRGAIEDAKANAEINGLTNTEYHCGNVEKLLPQIWETVQDSQDVVAVLNPGRNGVVNSVITELRRTTFINRLVYVSCNPAGNSMNNFVQLCVRGSGDEPGTLRFTPRFAVPVDMFPHADHFELVLLFER